MFLYMANCKSAYQISSFQVKLFGLVNKHTLTYTNMSLYLEKVIKIILCNIKIFKKNRISCLKELNPLKIWFYYPKRTSINWNKES